MTHLHMHAVGEDGQNRDGVDEDNLDKSVSGCDLGVDVGRVGDRLEAVKGNGCETQG